MLCPRRLHLAGAVHFLAELGEPWRVIGDPHNESFIRMVSLLRQRPPRFDALENDDAGATGRVLATDMLANAKR